VLITTPFGVAMLLGVTRWQAWPDRWGIGATGEGVSELKKNCVDFSHARFGTYNIGRKAAFCAFFGLLILLVPADVDWELFSNRSQSLLKEAAADLGLDIGAEPAALNASWLGGTGRILSP
jgi:hypothetical protein